MTSHTPKNYRVLWMEDSEEAVLIFTRHLKKEGIELDSVRLESLEELGENLRGKEWDALISDYNLPGFGPEDVIRVVKDYDQDLPIILLSGVLEAENAVDLMKSGVHDFVAKHKPARLGPVIEREVREGKIRRENVLAQEQLVQKNRQLDDTLQRLHDAQRNVVNQEKLRLMGDISFGISHEFNNSLMKILGLHWKIEADLGKEVPLDKHKDTIHQLGVTLGEATEVVKKLGSFYRDSVDGHKESVEFNSLVRESIDSAGSHWNKREPEKQIAVELEFSEQSGIIEGDRSDLIGAISNILANAADSMPDGGTIVAKTSVCDDKIMLEIIDLGCGMDFAEKKQCMEPFYSTKGEFGTGLGMCLTENIVLETGGSISFESEKSKGTTVRMRFPVSELMIPDADPVETSDVEDRSDDQLNILIAEDEPMVAMVIEEYLTYAGHKVRATANGGEAIEAFDEEVFDLVITDRSMPVLSGDELAVRIKEKSPTTPVFLMTGFGDLMIARGEVPEGVDRVIPKPINGKALQEVIQEGLAR